jgi:hypothetical protein
MISAAGSGAKRCEPSFGPYKGRGLVLKGGMGAIGSEGQSVFSLSHPTGEGNCITRSQRLTLTLNRTQEGFPLCESDLCRI